MSLPTLFNEPSATVYLDGLIILVHNAESKLTLAGIHTQAEHHVLNIEVTQTGVAVPVWPTQDSDWDGSHENVKSIAPLWLYVDCGRGRSEKEFAATLHEPHNLLNAQSFGHVLDFEGPRLYRRELDYNLNAMALLNIAHGTFYSAENLMSKLKNFGQNQTFDKASIVDHINVSSMVAADIDSKSEPEVKRSLVLEQSYPPKELFRLELEQGKHYEIKIENVPDDSAVAHAHTNSPDGHFLKYYDLFALKPEEKKFIVEFDHEEPSSTSVTQLSPPCNVGQGSGSSNFP
jgi:hypothetical protein